MKRHPLQRPLVALTALWFSSLFWIDFLPLRMGGCVFGALYVSVAVVALPWMATDGFRQLPERWRDI